MAKMIDFDSIVRDARANSAALDGTYDIGQKLGGEGGNFRSYIPDQDMTSVGTRGEVPGLGQLPVPQAPQEASQENGYMQSVEAVANDPSAPIDMLIQALQQMATMSPSQGGDPVFNLDAAYKSTDPNVGIPGTPAAFPVGGMRVRETEFGGYGNGGI